MRTLPVLSFDSRLKADATPQTRLIAVGKLQIVVRVRLTVVAEVGMPRPAYQTQSIQPS